MMTIRDVEMAVGSGAPVCLRCAIGLPRTSSSHRTAVLRAMLADRHDVAFAALARTLAQTAFYATGDNSDLALHVVTPALRAEGFTDSKAMQHGG